MGYTTPKRARRDRAIEQLREAAEGLRVAADDEEYTAEYRLEHLRAAHAIELLIMELTS
jgi:hypothetical protein